MGHALRILQVIDHLHLGGAQSLIYAMANLSAADGVEMYVAGVAPRGDAGLRALLESSCREVISLDARALWDVTALVRLLHVIRSRQIDLIHTHLATADVMGGVAAKLTRRPVVSSLHNIAADRHTHTRTRRVLASYATRALSDRLIAVSESVKATHVEQLGIPPSKLQVIRNVPIAPLLLPASFSPARKRAELGLGSGPVLCTVARLADTKDHATLFRAVRSLLRRRQDVTLLVVGDGLHRGALERLVEDLGIGNAVRFLGSRGDVVELMAASDVVCNITLTFEGLPIAVLDAMSLGKPLVATRTEGVEEVAKDGVTALLVPPQDPEALDGALERLLADPGEARRIGEAARESIDRQLDQREWIDKIESVYRELLHGGSRESRQRMGSHFR